MFNEKKEKKREITHIFIAKKTNKQTNKEKKEKKTEVDMYTKVVRLNFKVFVFFIFVHSLLCFLSCSLFFLITNSKQNVNENHLHIFHTVEFVD